MMLDTVMNAEIIPMPIEGNQERERINAAALRYNERLYTGPSHLQALKQLQDAYPQANMEEVEEGFVTDTERFVSRNEAKKLHSKTIRFPL